MNFQNYMQLEVKPELNENIIRFKLSVVLQKCDTMDNSAIATTLTAAKYGICNKYGQALFKQIDLQEGDIEMNNYTGTYPYQVDFENRVTYDERDLEGRPRLEGCIPDTASNTALARTHATQATKMLDFLHVLRCLIIENLCSKY